MLLYVNDEKIDFDLDNEKTFGDFLLSFETLCEKDEATIIGIKFDDTIVNADTFDNYKNTPIDSIKETSLTTICKTDIIKSYSNINELCQSLTKKLEEIPVNLQNNKDELVTKTVTDFTYFFDYFCRVISLSSLFSDIIENLTIDSKTPSVFLSDFSPILNDFENALKQKDTVLIGDLSEYEILPRIESIQITAKKISELK